MEPDNNTVVEEQKEDLSREDQEFKDCDGCEGHDLSEVISIDIRSLEVPASEYRALVTAQATLKCIRKIFKHRGYRQDVSDMVSWIVEEDEE